MRASQIIYQVALGHGIKLTVVPWDIYIFEETQAYLTLYK